MRDRDGVLPSLEHPVLNPEILSPRAVRYVRELIEARNWDRLREMYGDTPSPLFLSRLAVRKDRPRDCAWLSRTGDHERLTTLSFGSDYLTGITVEWFNPVTGLTRMAILKLDVHSLRYEVLYSSVTQTADPEPDPEALTSDPDWARSCFLPGSGPGICAVSVDEAPTGRREPVPQVVTQAD